MTAPYAKTVLTSKDRGEAAAQDGRPVLMATLGASCISASAVLIKLANTGPASAAFYRCAFALPVLALLAVLERRRRGGRPGTARAGAMFAGLFLAIDLVLWNHAIADVGAGIATVIGNLQVLFVTVAAWAVFHERPGRRFLVALPVVLTGVVLVSGLIDNTQRGMHPLAGIYYGLGTSIAYAFFLLILRQSTSGSPHVAGPLAEATLGCAVGSLLLGAIFGGLPMPSLPSLGWLLVLALTSQTAGWLLITSSLPRLPAAISSLLLLLQPAASIVLAAIILGEDPSALQLAGAVLVCGGVLFATSRARSSRSEPSAIRNPATPAPEPAGSRAAQTPAVVPARGKASR